MTYRSAPKVPASLATAMTRKSTWERRMVHYYRRTAQCRPAVYFIMVLAALGMGLSSLPSTFARFMGVLCGLVATMSWLAIGATLLRWKRMRRPMISDVPVTMPEWEDTSSESASPVYLTREPEPMTWEEEREEARQKEKWTLMRRLY
jgi:hypothetical protein